MPGLFPFSRMNHIQVETIFLNLIRQTEEFISAIVGNMPASDTGSFTNRLSNLFASFKSDKAAFTASSTQLGFLATLLKEYAAFKKQNVEDIGTPEILITVPKWGDIYDKPTTFPPSEHTHDAQPVASVAWPDITDKPTTFPPSEHTHDAQPVASVAWPDITDKPTAFPPEEHFHASKISKVAYVGNGAATRVISFDGAFLPVMFSVNSVGTTWNRWEGGGFSDLNSATFTTTFNTNGSTYYVLLWG